MGWWASLERSQAQYQHHLTAHINLCPNLMPECTFWEDESCSILCAQSPMHKSSMARRRGLVRGLLDGAAFQSPRGHLQLGRRIGPGYAAPLIYVQTRRCGPACMCIHEYQCAPLGTPVSPPSKILNICASERPTWTLKQS